MEETARGIQKLAAALIAAQMEMGAAMKNAVNPHLKNKYADLASCVEAAYPALHKHGLCISQTVHGHDPAFCTTTLIHAESGQWIESSIPMLIPANASNPSQAQGSALTYARRYGLSAIVGLIADDDDGEAVQPKPAQTQIKQPQAKVGSGATATVGTASPLPRPAPNHVEPATKTANSEIAAALETALEMPREDKPDVSKCQIVKGLVEKVEVKTGDKGGKLWKRFGIHVGKDIYGTFHESIGSAAVDAWTNKERVRLFVSARGQYKDLVWLEPLGDMEE